MITLHITDIHPRLKFCWLCKIASAVASGRGNYESCWLQGGPDTTATRLLKAALIIVQPCWLSQWYIYWGAIWADILGEIRVMPGTESSQSSNMRKPTLCTLSPDMVSSIFGEVINRTKLLFYSLHLVWWLLLQNDKNKSWREERKW